MRPLFHPSIEDITVEGILHALSDPVRATIFRAIATATCSQNCTVFASVGDREIPKSTLSQHFKALREAGLLRSERLGVEMQNISRCGEVNERFPGLLESILKAYQLQVGAKARKARSSARSAARRSEQNKTDAR